MSVKYKNVVPWGRNFDEYIRMFDFSEQELKQKILGCGDGPSCFNVECNRLAGNVTSIDPIYHMSKKEIQTRINETYDDVVAQTEQNKEKFKWNIIKSVEDLAQIRMSAMNLFLSSYEEGKVNKQYISGSVLELPFENNEFDLSISSHFLLLYTDNLSYSFHFDAITEMLRVSKEIRIFPLLDVNANKSPYVQKIISDFSEKKIEIRKVNYEFQIGGNEMIIISNKK